MTERTYGHTKSGRPVDDGLIEQLADEAEAGYDVDEIATSFPGRQRQHTNSSSRASRPAMI